MVNSEKLRFDFSHNEPITSDNIIKIENFVKKEITANSQIEIKTIDHQKALDEVQLHFLEKSMVMRFV